MVRSALPPEDPARQRGDYLLEGEDARHMTIGNQVLRLMRGLMVIVLILLSLALFWVVGLMLGVL